MIKVVNGCFGYPKSPQILSHLNFELEEEKIMTILGQNGIGKTTLIKCLTGVLRWTDGYTLIDNKKIGTVRDVKGLGYVPQAHPMAFSYTVRQVVMMGRARYIRSFSVPSAADWQAVEEAMREVGIQDLADKCCNQLSGGQLQLALIARALVGNPKIIILDEPESHLDFKNQFMILKLIESLAREKKISCIINTHFPEHALMISDQTLLLGRDQYAFGPTQEMIAESSISKFFQIKSKILDVPESNGKRKAFVVLEAIEGSGQDIIQSE